MMKMCLASPHFRHVTCSHAVCSASNGGTCTLYMSPTGPGMGMAGCMYSVHVPPLPAWVCTCMFTCVHACMCACACVRAFVFVCVCVYVCARVYGHMHAGVRTCVSKCEQVCVRAGAHSCACLCVPVSTARSRCLRRGLPIGGAGHLERLRGSSVCLQRVQSCAGWLSSAA